MVRVPCCEKMGLKKGPWTPEEDQILVSYIQQYGHANWRALPKDAGLLRCGKSCRLRWTNYLRPNIKRGNFSKEEDETIINLHQLLGNRWSAIAARLEGRTDNEIKNYWHTRLKKRLLKQNVTTIVGLSTEEAAKRDGETKARISQGVLIQSIGDASIPSGPQESSCFTATTTTGRRDFAVTLKSYQLVVEPTSAVEFPILSSVSTTMEMESMNGNISSVDHNMDFWYDLFMKAGDSKEVLGNLGQFR